MRQHTWLGMVVAGLMLLGGGLTARGEDQLRVIQFIHPGGEHRPDSAEGRSWNLGPHQRKFLLQRGRYLTGLGAEPREDDLVFWCEYEPPTRLVKTYEPTMPDGPNHLFALEPFRFKPRGVPLMNTDPFVFGGRFFYSICKQNNRRGPTAMQRLQDGSVILFGSGKGRNRFIVDTIFVVGDSVRWRLEAPREALEGMVPAEYFHAAVEPIVDEARILHGEARGVLRLYRGATPEEPVEGMFSFFPCLPAGEGAGKGFARPVIRRPGIITDNLTQGQRMNIVANLTEAREIWEDVATQVLAQGLCLGVYADMPELASE
ncbi:MAG: hypothetical protein GX803_01425 [Lentisphaerae bacterium]|nr:hypothetical protein [Lentisphaerota bacterium]